MVVEMVDMLSDCWNQFYEYVMDAFEVLEGKNEADFVRA